ncbi:FadR/GntR family transcriptional regulator [Lentibacillus saliphilus]|uniref:FadR/GntR family transcriptional regulator n=1 Tax=Lentibacillus saliphilus TaxID=2737028 RepID=UPI001C3054B4
MAISPRQKVYHSILEELRRLIERDDLKQGDRLPSERELSDVLGVGRSSVREALRALELLGLIETRRGEGTYLTVYQPYQSVTLLSTFILQENRTRLDLVAAKQILEKECAKLACKSLDQEDIVKLEAIISADTLTATERHTAFFQHIADKGSNHLLMKIWQLMQGFSTTLDRTYFDIDFLERLMQSYKNDECEMIEPLFSKSTYAIKTN